MALMTPCLLISLSRVEENCQKMHEFFAKQMITLVPHMKTHKNLDIAKIMTKLSDGNRRIIVSTLEEARIFAESRVFREITCAFHLTEAKINECSLIEEKVEKFVLMIGNDSVVHWLENIAPKKSKQWNVVVEVDFIHPRTGLMITEQSTFEFICRVANKNCISFNGLYLHCGGSYYASNVDEKRRIIETSIKELKVLAEKLRKVGIEGTISIGSTPSCSLQIDELYKGIDEVHPGNYVFYDAQQMSFGSCSIDDIACTVLSSIIGIYPDRNTMAIDCGWEAISPQKPESEDYFNTFGYARFRDHSHLKLQSVSQVKVLRWYQTPSKLFFLGGGVPVCLFLIFGDI